MGRAGLGVRLAAGLVDAVAMLLLYWICYLIIEPSEYTEHYLARVRWAILVGSVLMIGYSLCDVFLAASPGKLLFKLRVTGAMGEPASPGQLWARWGYRWGFLVLNLLCGLFYPYMIGIYLRVLCVTVFAAVVAYFTMLVTSYGWAVYDRWARTSVTLLGYLALPPGLGRIIYWTPTQAGGAAAAPPGFPVVGVATEQPPTAFTPPPPAPPAAPPSGMAPPPPPVPAGPGAPVGDVPTRVTSRRADEGPIPLDEPAPPANPA